MMLTASFFDRDAIIVAQDLLGKVIRRYFNGVWLSVMIIETEAYYRYEKGSHSSLGYTNKRKALFMDAGTIYMYYSRAGDSLNVSCHGAGNAVLLKSGIPYLAEKNSEQMLAMMHQLNPIKNSERHRPTMRLCSGQTLLCLSLGLKVPDWDQKTFHAEKLRIDDVGYRPKQIIQTTRLGISKGRDEHLPYRFIDLEYVKYATSNPLTKRNWELGKEYTLFSLPTEHLLSNLTVVLTSSQEDSQPLAEKIQGLGAKIMHFPSLEITQIKNKLLNKTLANINDFDIAIFLSKNAVRYVAPLWPKVSSNLNVLAIGPTTAKALAKANIPVSFCPKHEFNSEGLLAAPLLSDLQKKKVVIFKGKEGRDLLPKILKERGAEVKEIDVYERLLPSSDPSMLNSILNPKKDLPIFVVLSCESLQNLHTLFKGSKLYTQFMQSYLLAGSSRIAQFALSLHHLSEKIIQAQSPIADAILEKLIAWYAKTTRSQG